MMSDLRIVRDFISNHPNSHELSLDGRKFVDVLFHDYIYLNVKDVRKDHENGQRVYSSYYLKFIDDLKESHNGEKIYGGDRKETDECSKHQCLLFQLGMLRTTVKWGSNQSALQLLNTYVSQSHGEQLMYTAETGVPRMDIVRESIIATHLPPNYQCITTKSAEQREEMNRIQKYLSKTIKWRSMDDVNVQVHSLLMEEDLPRDTPLKIVLTRNILVTAIAVTAIKSMPESFDFDALTRVATVLDSIVYGDVITTQEQINWKINQLESTLITNENAPEEPILRKEVQLIRDVVDEIVCLE